MRHAGFRGLDLVGARAANMNTGFPKVLLLNGAFGIGKTSVARAIVEVLPETIIINPELIGVLLQRCLRVAGRTVDDFQDLSTWRMLTVNAVRTAAWRGRRILVPMAIDKLTYLAEVRSGIERAGLHCMHICLVAPEPVVHDRLRRRGADPVRNSWEYRRASECCASHTSSEFAHKVDATSGTIRTIAREVLAVWSA